ncbi:MAG: glycosyltransferase family 1 protein [Desulfobacterales bacterium]|nr:glycosyltransferase family 1 protein [Desulfobacterales bacterium]
MKTILFSLGTRGDIEPFLAIAQRLKKQGDDVVCAFPAQFKDLVDESEYEFHGLSEKFLELIESEKAKLVLGGKGNILKKASALIWMITTSQTMQKEVIKQQHDILECVKPDRVIYNQKCLFPIVWGMKNKEKTTLLSPLPCTVHEYEDHASLGMGGDFGRFFNRLTYKFSNFFLFHAINSATKKYQKELGLKLKYSVIKQHVLKEQKMIYTISPCLFVKPNYWNENVRIVGYHERKMQSDWKPSPEIQSFAKKHDKIVFITFGSMTNPEPEEKTKIILKVLSKHNISAIINTASGGLIKPKEFPENVFFTDSLPYSWILPKVYAAIHHGGSGTVHSALKHGCASMIIPHILDQHIWSYILQKIKVGPSGFRIKKFSEIRFEKQLLKLLNTKDYKDNALKLGAKLKEENLEDYLLATIKNTVIKK